MAATPSTMLPLGTLAPDFLLPDTVSGKMIRLYEYVEGKKGFVVMFLCNHCPYVKHINKALVKVASEFISQEIAFLGISSNDVSQYPEDSPQRMREVALTEGYPFPYLYDESQKVAKAYQAACTPDLYVFDGQKACYYRGQFDGSRPKNDVPVTGNDLRFALESLLKKMPPPTLQIPSIGCSIKWKKEAT